MTRVGLELDFRSFHSNAITLNKLLFICDKRKSDEEIHYEVRNVLSI